MPKPFKALLVLVLTVAILVIPHVNYAACAVSFMFAMTLFRLPPKRVRNTA